MALEARPELAGRRFVCASGAGTLELGEISRWNWRAGVIRGVSTRDTESPRLAVCVEWDGEAGAERHWRRLKEEWEVFVVEQELVWAKRKNSTSQENSSLQPALVFLPLIGQDRVGEMSVVEFVSDRQLEFYTEQEELRPFESEVDNSALREDTSCREQVQAWLRQRQLQHILQLGHGCVKGLRVKVFRHDSKPQWLYGTVSHHDHNSGTMTILSDQVSEPPLSVDPALTQVVFLDDIRQSLLLGENSTTKCKPHVRINRTTLNTINRSNNTTLTDQACSSRPVQRKQPQLCRQNSNCSLAEDEAEEMRENKRADEVRADSSKNRINHVERKRRKMGEEEEQNEKEKRRVGLKRIKAGSGSDLSDGSDSEDSSCRLQEMSCVVGSNNLPRNCCISNRPADHETAHSLPVGRTVQDLITRSSPKGKEHSPSHISELDGQRVGESPHSEVRLPSPSCNGTFQSTGVPDPQCTEGPGCDKTEEERGAGEVLEDRSEGASQEDSEAVSALLASQESEQLVSMETACVLLHTSSPECEAVEGDQENPQNDPEVRGSALNHPEAATSRSESAASLEEESRGALTQSPIMPCNAEVEAGKVAKLSQSPGASSGPELKTALVSEMTHKPTVLPSPCSSPEIISKPPVVTEASRLRLNESPEVSRIKESSSPIKVTTAKALIGLKSTPGPKVTCSTILNRSHASPPLPTDQPARSRTPPQNLSAVLDKPTKSPLIIDKNEPFTVYRDPALVRKELENHPTYIQPAHTPPTPHSKHHLKSPPPSSSSPNLTSTSSHAKILSPTPHLSLPSQTPLCSPHPSIPHPHLLPSLLPGLPPSTALLAGHTRLGPLGLPHHPLALQPTPSLLAQSAGTSHLAPLGLYPLLWPPFPNGAHNYGLGLQGSKWAPPESAGMYEANLRRNTPSPWLPQPTPVASAEGQGLRTPLPVRPSSADPHRVSRAVQPSTPTSKTTEELERRAFTETQRMIHTPIKIEQERVRATVERNGHNYRPVAPESPSNCPKQPQVVYDLTGDRTSHYQEESRRILQESIEVAPFTAKLGSDREAKYSKSPVIHSKQREGERERDKEQEREMHVFRHSLPPRPQSAHPSPTHTQTNYYTPVTGGVENKSSARRAPPSKELYERLSGPNTAPSVLHSASTQSTVKARPPPLVKRHPEKEEGLLGKIAEQLACKAKSMISVEPVEHCCIERKGSSTSLISISNSSSRAVHSLHRAPIFHPPAPPVVASKEAGQGRLSPPTLTPIQPMSLSGKAQNQQRPPTLMPELRHGAVAGKRMAPEPINVTSQTYDLQRGGVLHNRERVVGGQTTNGGMITPQSATASVIVRPSSYVHAPMNYSVSERSLPQAHCEHVRTFESVPTTHLKESSSVQCKRGVLWTPVDTVHPVNMVTSKQDVNVPLNMTTKNMNSTYFNSRGVKYSANIETPYSRADVVTEHCKKEAMVVQPNLDVSSVSCCPTRDIPHVKKRRAGLAAPEPRHNTYTVQPLHTTQTLNVNKNVLQMPHSRYSTYITHSTHTICTAHALNRETDSVFNPSPPKCPRLSSEVPSVGETSKPCSVTKGHPPALSVHTNQPAQSGQNNYHKLKKAWLTRHSEQDRGSANPQVAGGSQIDATITTTSYNTPPIKQEVNGLENKWSNQESKESCMDKRKSKSLERKCLPEDRKSNGSDTKTKTDDKKPVMGDKKATLEDIKPILDRNGNLEDKKPSSQNKKVCADEKKPTPITVKTEKGKGNCGDKHGDSGNESENRKSVNGGKRQPKSIHIKKQNEQQKKRGDHVKEENEEDEEEEEGKSNVNLRTTKEKSLHRLPNTNGIPRSVLKDWRKVKKLKQSGEAFLQDDSCAEIGANVQKCRECRLDRSRKAQEPAISPVFCRFYYFRRLSYSKNGVVRVDGFSVAEDTDEDAVRVWMAGFEIEDEWNKKEMELNLAKYILTLIGDKFCLLVKTENIAVTWVKKETQVMWKRAVRGVREMCDACEATLFNIHWACHKCGFVVCMDCYKARERKSAKDKELYAWVRCVKNQPHDLKNLMPTQIIPETVLTGLQSAIHTIRREYGIPSHCSCSGSSLPAFSPKPITTNGLSLLSEKTQCDSKSQHSSPKAPDQQKSAQDAVHKTPTERRGKSDCDGLEVLGRKSSSPEQGSTLRDLLTSTAGKLRLGSTGPGIAFAPVYNSTDQNTQNARMPNLLDDIIASVVENKIPASKIARLGLKQDLLTEEEVELGLEEAKPEQLSLADPHASVPHDWLGSHRLLWLKDHRHLGNQRLFKENWTQEQPVLVSGLQKSLNASLWKPEHFSKEFSALHSDIYNCRDGSITNSRVKEFWDGFEDVSKRPKSAKGDPAVYRLKDWPSGEEFLALMPSRYENVMSFLPVPDYTGPDGTLNLASRLPSFFIRPDLGPRLCCAHGVTACPEQDFGTSNLHVEISDTMNILVYVGVAKGTGALSKTGVLKLLEREVLDESAKKRLKDPNETPGALWHIFLSKDLHKIQEFLQTLSAEHGEADTEADSDAECESEADPLREGGWYLSPRLRQRLLEQHGVESRTLLQFYGDAVIIPAGALHQVMNLHSCIQVNVDFVSPEHAHNSYYLTQELRPLKDQVNYEDKLQVKNIIYHSVKDAVATLSRHLKEQVDEFKEEES
ncbi:probable JmjC domain-containing histone demethylation protein 2C isoform X2 [Astyanax mexicanus]|uniref:probable JmjC domain-containing histone demethylation protein 2C isoform X2 n=1 Tax=Astyanax mexicanus TaxID=7994 RepID=UPI0020CAA551|nr:probable JmjC domain-containing histone demethylation protein 2C isoform X2 [Astyanax mexicanus]